MMNFPITPEIFLLIASAIYPGNLITSYNRTGGERTMFDWNLFLNIIIAILQAIVHVLPA